MLILSLQVVSYFCKIDDSVACCFPFEVRLYYLSFRKVNVMDPSQESDNHIGSYMGQSTNQATRKQQRKRK